jgi:hypothetical protein
MKTPMSDLPERECSRFAGELTRVACGDGSALGTALQAHLETCARCSEFLRDGQALAPALIAALTPPALSDAAAQRVLARLATRTNEPRVLRLPPWRTGLAAAAAAAMCVLWPFESQHAAESVIAARPGVLDSDAAAIAAAFGLANEADAMDASVSSAAAAAAALETSLETRRNTESVLTWTTDEDWDLPTDPAGSHSGSSGGQEPATR